MTVANHLTLNELWRRAKKAKDPIEKDRFLAVYHAKRGLTAKEIARIIPNTPRWVQETVRRYNLEGPEALRTSGIIPFYAESLVLGHQWNRVCRLRVSGSWARTRHRSATTSIISSRSPKYRLATASFTKGHTRSTGWSSGE
jgi:hypothetical protein